MKRKPPKKKPAPKKRKPKAKPAPTGRGRRTTKKAAPKRRRAPKREPIHKKVQRIEKALPDFELVLEGGRIFIGRTGWLTPTRSGLRALDRTIALIGKSRGVFTFDLRVRFNGKDGSPQERELLGIGLPRKKDVHGSIIEYVHALLRRAVFATLKDEFGEMSPQLTANLSRYAERKARKLLNDMKSRRRARFRVTIYREVSSGERRPPTRAMTRSKPKPSRGKRAPKPSAKRKKATGRKTKPKKPTRRRTR